MTHANWFRNAIVPCLLGGSGDGVPNMPLICSLSLGMGHTKLRLSQITIHTSFFVNVACYVSSR